MTAWPFRASTAYEWVEAGMMMNATTEVRDWDFDRRKFRPKWTSGDGKYENWEVRTSHRLNEHVYPLITIFVSTRNKHLDKRGISGCDRE